MKIRNVFILTLVLVFSSLYLPLCLWSQESEVAPIPLGVMEEYQYQAKLNELEKIFELLQLNSNYLLLNSDLSLTDLEQMSIELEMSRIRLIEIEESLTQRLISLTTVTSLLEKTTKQLDVATTLLESYVEKVRALEKQNKRLKVSATVGWSVAGVLAIVAGIFIVKDVLED